MVTAHVASLLVSIYSAATLSDESHLRVIGANEPGGDFLGRVV